MQTLKEMVSTTLTTQLNSIDTSINGTQPVCTPTDSSNQPLGGVSTYQNSQDSKTFQQKLDSYGHVILVPRVPSYALLTFKKQFKVYPAQGQNKKKGEICTLKVRKLEKSGCCEFIKEFCHLNKDEWLWQNFDTEIDQKGGFLVHFDKKDETVMTKHGQTNVCCLNFCKFVCCCYCMGCCYCCKTIISEQELEVYKNNQKQYSSVVPQSSCLGFLTCDCLYYKIKDRNEAFKLDGCVYTLNKLCRKIWSTCFLDILTCCHRDEVSVEISGQKKLVCVKEREVGCCKKGRARWTLPFDDNFDPQLKEEIMNAIMLYEMNYS